MLKLKLADVELVINNGNASKERIDMEADVTIEEIKNAVWDCETDKSLRPDGFLFDFYRHFWSVIQKDVVAVKKQSFIFKIDFEKAYDSVRWDYLEDVLKKFGFGEKWCKWIRECLRSSWGLVIVNGSPMEEFQFFKGLKQDTIIYALKCFERASGLRMNMSKSKIMGIAINAAKVDQVAHRIGCGILEVPFT
nr:RNA-directed DNA polymerase, eukaryota, reverse transcriptase zinc-binding domain protein [Tanacetum cinerariifolium]